MIVDPTVDLLVALALAFAFSNGYNGSGTLVATLISTGAMGARQALLLAALASFVGLFVLGLAVALVVGQGIVEPAGITLASVGACLVASFLWIAFTARSGIPSSSSHTLVGGLIGGGIAAGGLRVVEIDGLLIVALALLIAPVLAGLLGALAMQLVLWLARGAPPRINQLFRRGQLITSTLLALGFGSSNGQKVVGVIALILYRAGVTRAFIIPDWTVLATSLALSLGIALGGWQVIRTLGGKIFRLRPVHGFTAQGVSVVVVVAATLLGGPISLTQIASSAIIGAGAAERMSKVRWGVAEHLAVSWLITMPLTALVAMALYPVAKLFLGVN